ncbi:type II toxin-antitoxin system RelE family toxin [Pseudomonas brassicacearum]|uniref:type II toxin-antitoxin system RelE family toxin n=2 Tax=Pseudomonas TaxID=286 RepID=UPI001BDE8292|nr:type II toxin-antitoxin system RelE/ParE family toxin [Pseudomonas brassicacearum]
MGVDYDVEWDPKALKELRKVDGAIRLQLLKKLQTRQGNPRVPGDALHGMKDCYKIKLRGAGYRLVYRVEDERIVILVVAIG